MVFIKTVPKGGLGIDADNERKRKELDQTKGNMGKAAQKDNYWGTKAPGYSGHVPKGSASAWQDRGGWRTPQKKQPWFAAPGWEATLDDGDTEYGPEAWKASRTEDKEGRRQAGRKGW